MHGHMNVKKGYIYLHTDSRPAIGANRLLT